MEEKNRTRLELTEPAETDMTVGVDTGHFLDILQVCDGSISIIDPARPITVHGPAEHTIVMPSYISDKDRLEMENLGDAPRKNPAEDIRTALEELQRQTAQMWEEIKHINSLIHGIYSAADLKKGGHKAKCGYFSYPEGERQEQPVEFMCGAVSVLVPRRMMFETLWAWESSMRCKKSRFTV